MSEASWKFHEHEFVLNESEPGVPGGGPWAGHRRFAYDLIVNLRPRLVVELGVEYGTSYFAFAKAIVDHDIDCILVGVDTWLGDSHTGAYGEGVYTSFCETLEGKLGADPRLRRMRRR